MSPRDVLITGIGLVSSLGEGVETHWHGLTQPAPPILDCVRFTPFTVHPLPEIDWSLQIAKRGDQRQMETWQRLGTYAAGLALDDAGLKGDEALTANMDMIVAAGGGERDEAVDAAILAASESRNDRDILLNEKLTTELRPTLFLAQLSNLLAGNISIVHKVTGSSRTFMGEEGAGVAAVETAAARIAAGQADHVLVGGAYQTEHPDMLLAYELGHYLHRGRWRPVWSRAGADGGGVVTGSGSAFLVLESRDHAERRGRKAYARLDKVVAGRARRYDDALRNGLTAMFERLGATAGEPLLAVSGASGAHRATAAERNFLGGHPELVARGFGSLTGHVKEAQFPFAIGVAALAVARQAAYPPLAEDEQLFDAPITAALATAIGFHRFEGMALIAPATRG